MKKGYIFAIMLLVFVPFMVKAQNDCPPAEAIRMLNQAKAELKKGHYEKALNKCNSAANCDPSLVNQANALIIKIYKDIEQQKDNAEENEKEAKEQTRKA